MANVVSDPKEFEAYHSLALGLGLDVLCEVHTEAELAVLPPGAKICGINSRKFGSDRRFFLSRFTRTVGKDASVDLSAFDLYDRLPPQCLKIAESGVKSGNIRSILEKYDFNAALIGTSLLVGGADQIQVELDRLQAEIAEVRRIAAHAPAHERGSPVPIDKLPHAVTS